MLLADDAPIILHSLRDLLEHAQYINVIGQVTNSQQVLDFVKVHCPDVIILDIEMPMMDGITVMRKLRKNSFTHPILILTGYAEYYMESVFQGANGFLLKGYAAEHIVEAVWRAYHG